MPSARLQEQLTHFKTISLNTLLREYEPLSDKPTSVDPDYTLSASFRNGSTCCGSSENKDFFI